MLHTQNGQGEDVIFQVGFHCIQSKNATIGDTEAKNFFHKTSLGCLCRFVFASVVHMAQLYRYSICLLGVFKLCRFLFIFLTSKVL